MSPATPRHATASRRRQLSLFAYALVAPVVLLIVGLVAYPFFYAIYVSFTDRVVGNVGKWIGFANFRYLAQTRRPSTAPSGTRSSSSSSRTC